ncbi:MAG TPA: CARDB domain-containing protein [Burkholderiales bacterium]|nr:CARDB domain-containing protein [Burkholderiales bacterium]
MATMVRFGAILGFVAIITIGMWGSISVAKGAPGVFSSIASAIVSLTSVFVPAGETIVISVPALTVNAGEAFGLSWEHAKKSSEGSYTFRYDCADGTSFTSPAPSGSQALVYCNVPFNFLNSGNAIALIAASSQNRFIDVTLHIDFTPNGKSRPTVTGSSLLTIVNEAIGGSPTATGTTPAPQTPAPETPTPSVPRTPGAETSTTYPITGGAQVSNPSGFIDLSVRVIEIGFVDKNTGVFTASSTPRRTDSVNRVAVRFAVENLGTKVSPSWSFNAVLPTFPAHIFSSNSQPALGPGDRIEYTLAFDGMIDQNETTLTINVDPTSSVNEPNKTNNIIKYTVKTVR